MRGGRAISRHAFLGKKNELDAQLEGLPEIAAARVEARKPASRNRKTEREDPLELHPYWLAARVVAFTAETSWSEAFILVWLPVARGEQYYHALLKRAGFRTYLPKETEPGGFRPTEVTEDEDFQLAPLADDPDLAAALQRFQLDTPASSS